MGAAAPAERATRMRGRVKEVEPPLRVIPVGPGYVEHRTEDGRRIFLHRDVLADLELLECREYPDETAGLLFGRLFTDGRNPCALVRHLVWPEPGEVVGTPATVTITAEGSTGMTRRANERHPCADAVGWAHTHPTFSAYFSATDRAEQAVWTEPASVGLVFSGLDDAEPRYEVFVGSASSHAEPVRSGMTRRRVAHRPRPSRLSATQPPRAGRAPASALPLAPPPKRNPVESASAPDEPEPAPSRPRPRSLPKSATRGWAAVAVVGLLAVIFAILWAVTDGSRGSGSAAQQQSAPAPIEIYQMPWEVGR